LDADPASCISSAKLAAIESAALAACDAFDGRKDGIIDDPRKCRFDPGTLLCRGAESNNCLTESQIAALKRMYSEDGYFPGGETAPLGWAAYITGSAPGKSFINLLRSQSRGMPSDRGPILDATDTNLKAFEKRGGKLILFHGWSDPGLPPIGTIRYFESVAATMGLKDAARFTRLYMVPGMQHCYGGPGPNTFGEPMTAALERWVERGSAPDRIVATKYRTEGDPGSGVARTRPLCPYPQVARYQGSGNIDEAASFACVAPRP